jgi:hypothetical protein
MVTVIELEISDTSPAVLDAVAAQFQQLMRQQVYNQKTCRICSYIKRRGNSFKIKIHSNRCFLDHVPVTVTLSYSISIGAETTGVGVGQV